MTGITSEQRAREETFLHMREHLTHLTDELARLAEAFKREEKKSSAAEMRMAQASARRVELMRVLCKQEGSPAKVSQLAEKMTKGRAVNERCTKRLWLKQWRTRVTRQRGTMLLLTLILTLG